MVVSGPAGTGKSRACLEKLHLCCLKYPGSRALICRKTRVSLTESGLVTYEEKVLPPGSRISDGPSRENRRAYHYPHGSEVVVGGLDRASRIMSTEYDLIYVQEAIELAEGEWEALSTRLRNGVMPYQQMLADTNPDTPWHWLKRRAEAGKCLMLESRHEDNPTVTPAYLAKLDALTGARLQRLRYGRWVGAEGLVYEEWDRAKHVVPRSAVRAEWPRWWSIDFGFTNPFVWQEWSQDPDGRLYLGRELYRTGRLVEDHCREILRLEQDAADRRLMKGPRGELRGIVCDHDAEGRATLERHLGKRTVAAKKDVSAGIQAVQARLQVAGDGRPRLFICEGATLERDPELVDAAKPSSTAEEFDGYIWDLQLDKPGKGPKEEPVKKDDHGLDALRYVVAEVDGLGRKRLRFL